MDASCFLTSKISSKSVDFIPPFNTRISSPFKRSSAKWLHTFPSAPSPSSITTCNLQSRLPDDDHDQWMKSDWRSFRARLVAGEQASCNSAGDRWVHRLHEPEKGCILIATEKLDGVHIFERAIILLISTGPLCPTGVILNRPSLMSFKETKSTAFDVYGTFSNRPLFFGGPLEEGLFLVRSRKGGEEEEDGVGKSGVFEEVMKGLYCGTKESVGCAAEMVKRNVVGVEGFRFFDGYCGWEKDQLKEEIRAGYWNVMACSLSVVEMTSAGLGEEVMGLVGERKVG
ncbi:hypothetical protein KFK09_027516 [Dendrobium nobile]|uniref:Uncharacterized protein n=1 Tax=Dendrobium nobile TaxID=94219 RepID=A0A8T3AAP3_DENNO|nr:hypothetical protein KFK09_027516 [Dendrobium nobile]